MGIYLNSTSAYSLYKRETEKPYFVDKSLFLAELIDTVQSGNHYICITRPRRFGKTVMANMIGAFFSNAYESGEIFDKLKISEELIYNKYKNQYKVIQISFNQMPKNCNSYEKYMERIENKLIMDLKQEYPHILFDEEVDLLYEKYKERETNPMISREDLKEWYDGYQTR